MRSTNKMYPYTGFHERQNRSNELAPNGFAKKFRNWVDGSFPKRTSMYPVRLGRLATLPSRRRAGSALLIADRLYVGATFICRSPVRRAWHRHPPSAWFTLRARTCSTTPEGGSKLDVRVHDDGTLSVVKPETDLARDWIRAHVSPDGDQPHWPTLVVEPRFLDDLLVGMFNDGLRVGI